MFLDVDCQEFDTIHQKLIVLSMFYSGYCIKSAVPLGKITFRRPKYCIQKSVVCQYVTINFMNISSPGVVAFVSTASAVLVLEVIGVGASGCGESVAEKVAVSCYCSQKVSMYY